MNFKSIIFVFLTFVSLTDLYSQTKVTTSRGNEILTLKSDFLKTDNLSKKPEINTSTSESKKSPGVALLLSLVLPGSGHYYLNRMDVGKYFLGADVACWLGFITLNVYGNSVNDDAISFSTQHADVNTTNKDDNYYANVGNYDNIYEYNNAQLTYGAYSMIYNVDQYYWNWDNVNNRNTFESQRKSSERILNNRIIFGSLLIANRIVAGISSYILAKNMNKKPSAFNIEPELLYKKDLSFDGVKINLVKNF
ncbi:MAG TPA: hypothetical protein PKC91_06240 [Ignavibacteria bacterium]|nr:hypothetical protein [Ignavibacteria bacterium]